MPIRREMQVVPPTKENHVTRCLLTLCCKSTDLLKNGTDQLAVRLVQVSATIGATEDVLSLLCEILQHIVL